jgi:UDP-N-acetylmuramoyl-L-alanyl-D-glutamate--2,6-diaminopimelate ligase
MTATLGELAAAFSENEIHALATAEASEVVVYDVHYDSRSVSPGSLFCCVVGESHDGHDHTADAVQRGAAAVLTQRHMDLDVATLTVPDTRIAMPLAAATVHGHPSRSLDVVGVTGTNGKTTTVHLIDAICRHARRPSMAIGTLTGERTTPEAPDLQRTLRRAADDGIEVVAMEVSSHAVAQHRVDALEVLVGVFTNLGQDHLDYHGTMESYFRAKAAFFSPDRVRTAVVDVDGTYGRLLADAASVEVRAISQRDLEIIDRSISHTTFVWMGREVTLPLGGDVNVRNAHAAAEVGQLLGFEPDQIVAGLNSADPLPGRFRPVDNEAGLTVIVDYAHTPDALDRLLNSAAELATGRVRLVFGCGGDRDRDKRSAMGTVAERGADDVIVTSDNPRGEDPTTIIDEIVQGMSRPPRHTAIDRRAAIEVALGEAQIGDIVLIAGKGHETTQTIGDQTVEFDDAAVAAEIMAELA